MTSLAHSWAAILSLTLAVCCAGGLESCPSSLDPLTPRTLASPGEYTWTDCRTAALNVDLQASANDIFISITNSVVHRILIRNATRVTVVLDNITLDNTWTGVTPFVGAVVLHETGGYWTNVTLLMTNILFAARATAPLVTLDAPVAVFSLVNITISGVVVTPHNIQSSRPLHAIGILVAQLLTTPRGNGAPADGSSVVWTWANCTLAVKDVVLASSPALVVMARNAFLVFLQSGNFSHSLVVMRNITLSCATIGTLALVPYVRNITSMQNSTVEVTDIRFTEPNCLAEEGIRTSAVYRVLDLPSLHATNLVVARWRLTTVGFVSPIFVYKCVDGSTLLVEDVVFQGTTWVGSARVKSMLIVIQQELSDSTATIQNVTIAFQALTQQPNASITPLIKEPLDLQTFLTNTRPMIGYFNVTHIICFFDNIFSSRVLLRNVSLLADGVESIHLFRVDLVLESSVELVDVRSTFYVVYNGFVFHARELRRSNVTLKRPKMLSFCDCNVTVGSLPFGGLTEQSLLSVEDPVLNIRTYGYWPEAIMFYAIQTNILVDSIVKLSGITAQSSVSLTNATARSNGVVQLYGRCHGSSVIVDSVLVNVVLRGSRTVELLNVMDVHNSTIRMHNIRFHTIADSVMGLSVMTCISKWNSTIIASNVQMTASLTVAAASIFGSLFTASSITVFLLKPLENTVVIMSNCSLVLSASEASALAAVVTGTRFSNASVWISGASIDAATRTGTTGVVSCGSVINSSVLCRDLVYRGTGALYGGAISANLLDLSRVEIVGLQVGIQATGGLGVFVSSGGTLNSTLILSHVRMVPGEVTSAVLCNLVGIRSIPMPSYEDNETSFRASNDNFTVELRDSEWDVTCTPFLSSSDCSVVAAYEMADGLTVRIQNMTATIRIQFAFVALLFEPARIGFLLATTSTANPVGSSPVSLPNATMSRVHVTVSDSFLAYHPLVSTHQLVAVALDLAQPHTGAAGREVVSSSTITLDRTVLSTPLNMSWIHLGIRRDAELVVSASDLRSVFASPSSSQFTELRCVLLGPLARADAVNSSLVQNFSLRVVLWRGFRAEGLQCDTRAVRCGHELVRWANAGVPAASVSNSDVSFANWSVSATVASGAASSGVHGLFAAAMLVLGPLEMTATTCSVSPPLRGTTQDVFFDVFLSVSNISVVHGAVFRVVGRDDDDEYRIEAPADASALDVGIVMMSSYAWLRGTCNEIRSVSRSSHIASILSLAPIAMTAVVEGVAFAFADVTRAASGSSPLSGIEVVASPLIGSAADTRVEVRGLWLGVLPGGTPNGGTSAALVHLRGLHGDASAVTIRLSTLDWRQGPPNAATTLVAVTQTSTLDAHRTCMPHTAWLARNVIRQSDRTLSTKFSTTVLLTSATIGVAPNLPSSRGVTRDSPVVECNRINFVKPLRRAFPTALAQNITKLCDSVTNFITITASCNALSNLSISSRDAPLVETTRQGARFVFLSHDAPVTLPSTAGGRLGVVRVSRGRVTDVLGVNCSEVDNIVQQCIGLIVTLDLSGQVVVVTSSYDVVIGVSGSIFACAIGQWVPFPVVIRGVVPPIPLPLWEATGSTRSIASIVGGFSSPGVGMGMSRTTLVYQIALCAFSDSEPMARYDSPMLFHYGGVDGAYQRGSVFGNCFLVALMTVAALLLSTIIHLRTRMKHFKESFQQSMRYISLQTASAKTHCPSNMVIPGSWILQPTIASAVALLNSRWDGGNDVAVGLFGLFVPLGLLLKYYWCILFRLPKSCDGQQRRVVFPRESSVSGYLEWFTKPNTKWTQRHVADDPLFKKKYFELFTQYQPNFSWFLIIETASCVIYGILQGLRPSSQDGCDQIAVVILVLSTVMLLGCLWARPYATYFDEVILHVNNAFTAAAALILVLPDPSGTNAATCDYIAVTQVYVSALLTVLWFVNKVKLVSIAIKSRGGLSPLLADTYVRSATSSKRSESSASSKTSTDAGQQSFGTMTLRELQQEAARLRALIAASAQALQKQRQDYSRERQVILSALVRLACVERLCYSSSGEKQRRI